jgi:RNA polymerase sigma-70 factor (ECF subfamily)
VDDLTRLLLAARDGDRLALAQAIRLAQPDVYRFVAALVGPADAEDVAQDALVRTYRALPGFRGESQARTWIFGIARRAAADALRARGRRARLRARLEDRAAAAAVMAPERGGAHALEDLLGRLPADRREAFVLTQVLGCTYDEAAGVCSVPVGTIRSRVARAREDLVQAVRAAETG